MEREFYSNFAVPNIAVDSKSSPLERQRAHAHPKSLPRAGSSNWRRLAHRRQTKAVLQHSWSGLGTAVTSRGIGGTDSTGSTRKPPSGSSVSVMVAAHCEHNQKCTVSRCGVSSSWLEFSSTAEIEMEVISN